MRLIRRDSLVPQPWKNGGGVTREIAAHPPGAGWGDFDWRLSMAEVAQDGPFSSFPGVDRTLTVIAGRGMALNDKPLAVGQPFRFRGEDAVMARLADGPITDMNVMTRRDRASHEVRVLAPGQAVPRGVVALFALAAAGDLAAGDTMLADQGDLDGMAAPTLALAIIIGPPDGGAGFPAAEG